MKLNALVASAESSTTASAPKPSSPRAGAQSLSVRPNLSIRFPLDEFELPFNQGNCVASFLDGFLLLAMDPFKGGELVDRVVMIAHLCFEGHVDFGQGWPLWLSWWGVALVTEGQLLQ